jgi:exonuclease VII small subunit
MTNHYEQCIASLENEIRSREQERVKLIEAIEGL